MKFAKPLRLADLAQELGCRYVGNADHEVRGLNEIHRAQPGDIVFSDVPKYFGKALKSSATTLLFNQETEMPAGKALLISEDPFRDFNRLSMKHRPRHRLDLFTEPLVSNKVRIGQNVVFGGEVLLGSGVEIGHNVSIGHHVTIGNGTLIHPNVTLYSNTVIGSNCIIHSGAVIGSDAFYFKKYPHGREKLHSSGWTLIGSNVEIGAGTCIDKGVTAETIIADGTKLDNLVQVGHDVMIGERCVIAAQVGIAGTCVLENDVMIYGQVGLATGVRIKRGTTILAQSGVMDDLGPDQSYFGYPARVSREQWRQEVALSKLASRWADIERLLDNDPTKR